MFYYNKTASFLFRQFDRHRWSTIIDRLETSSRQSQINQTNRQRFSIQKESVFSFLRLFESIMSTLDSISSAGQIIGLVIGIISAIATIICCIMAICYCCKNKGRSNVWAEPPPPYYHQNQSYGRTTNTPYHYQQQPPTYSTNTYYEKY